MEIGYIKECVCPICKKTFLPAPMHIYKNKMPGADNNKLVCSWSCQLESERRWDAKRKRKTYNNMMYGKIH